MNLILWNIGLAAGIRAAIWMLRAALEQLLLTWHRWLEALGLGLFLGWWVAVMWEVCSHGSLD